MNGINVVVVGGQVERVKKGSGKTTWMFFTVAVPWSYTDKRTGELREGKDWVEVQTWGESALTPLEDGDWVEVQGRLKRTKGSDEQWRLKVDAQRIVNWTNQVAGTELAGPGEPEMDTPHTEPDDDDIPF